MPPRLHPRATLCLALALLPACAGEPRTDEAASLQDTTSAPSGETSSLPSPDALTDRELDEIEREDLQFTLNWALSPAGRLTQAEAASPTLTEWRVLGREGFDRLVLTFGEDDPMPGYRVAFVQGPVRDCTSDAPVETEAPALLQVRIAGAAARDRDGASTIQRDTSIRPRRNLKELHLVCEDGDGLEFVLGLASQRPYRILEVRSPPRLVLDVKNTLGG